jgi:hypothetical protein
MTKQSKALSNPAALLKKNLAEANQRIAQSDSSRVSVERTGFTAPGQDEAFQKLEIIVVDYTLVHSFWPGPYDADNIVDPDCYANNRIFTDLVPHEDSPDKQAETCAVCPMNQWGSAPVGKGKACKNSRLLAILPPDGVSKAPMWTVSVSPTGTKRWDVYTRDLAKNNLTPMFVRTKITLMPGLKYASLNFELEEALDGDTVNDVIARLGDAQHLLDRPPQWEDEKKKK